MSLWDGGYLRNIDGELRETSRKRSDNCFRHTWQGGKRCYWLRSHEAAFAKVMDFVYSETENQHGS
jgi:hypothetical protein